MYTALYRTFRPETFDEILGQEHIVKILKNQIATGSVSHAYLFCGTRGTGKTSTARILAKAVNCVADGDRPCGTCENCQSIRDGNFMDVIEIDAASNNGVENIRELRESVKYPPAQGSKKVYIIDEVHMLTQGAYNALLKTLEEPPEYVMFILATTEPQKLPATILSRCMRLDFRRVAQTTIAEAMTKICAERGVSITEEAARLLANCADGSVRDGLSILDQVLAGGDEDVDRDKVLEYVGTTGEAFLMDLTELVSLRKSADALVLLNQALQDGKDVKQVMQDWVSYYRSLLITKFVKDAEDMLNLSAESLEEISKQSQRISLDEIDFAITRLSKTINDARWSTNPRVLLELAIVSIAGGQGHEERVMAKAEPATRPQPQAKSEVKAETATRPQPQPKDEVKPEPKAKPESKVKAEPKGENEAGQSTSQSANQGASQGANQELSEKVKIELWTSIFESGKGSAGSFNLLRSGTRLIELTHDTFVITANSAFTKKFADQKRRDLEEIMTQRLGRPMKLLCRLQEDGGQALRDQEQDTAISAEDLAKEAQELLGITIDVE